MKARKEAEHEEAVYTIVFFKSENNSSIDKKVLQKLLNEVSEVAMSNLGSEGASFFLSIDEFEIELIHIGEESAQRVIRIELRRQFPGTWFTASIALSQEDIYPAYFVICRNGNQGDPGRVPAPYSIVDHVGLITRD